MKQLMVIIILLVTTIANGFSQINTSTGIVFKRGLSWEEVLQKAKNENKCVFVDCYATWCGPCKWMDKNVYPVDSVGTFINDKFISVRLQMDTSRHDDEETRYWYATARAIEEKYNINVYPSYLFFSPEGHAIHEGIGGKDISEFLSMARSALDPRQQYYTLLSDYRKGGMNYALMPVLANTASNLGQDSISKQVSRDYIHHYLETLPEVRLWTKANILFLGLRSSYVQITDKIFQLYYRNKIAIDSAMHDGRFSEGFIGYILYRDEVKPNIELALKIGIEPKWHNIEKWILKYYDLNNAEASVLHGRIEYYSAKKSWKNYIKYFIREQKMNGIESWGPGPGSNIALNNNAYEVFKYDGKKRELKRALSWINRALDATSGPDPQAMDTKANLLYKLGQKPAALTLEEKAHSLSPNDNDISTSYEKMKKGLPTWVTE